MRRPNGEVTERFDLGGAAQALDSLRCGTDRRRGTHVGSVSRRMGFVTMTEELRAQVLCNRRLIGFLSVPVASGNPDLGAGLPEMIDQDLEGLERDVEADSEFDEKTRETFRGLLVEMRKVRKELGAVFSQLDVLHDVRN